MWFFAIYTTTLALVYFFVASRLIGPTRWPRRRKLLAWAIVFLLLSLPPIAIAFRVLDLGGAAESLLAWVGYVGMAWFTFTFFIILIRDLLWLVFRLGLKVAGRNGQGRFDREGRRRLTLTTNAVIVIITVSLTGYGVYEANRLPDVKEGRVPLENLPPEFEGFRFVQITDLHVGPTIKRIFVEKVVDKVMELNPDCILLTGDLVDGQVPDLRADVEPLARLAAPHGKFFVTGNHEYYSGVTPWVEEVKRLGFTVLTDEHRVIEKGPGRVVLAGVPDIHGYQIHPDHASDADVAFKGAPEGLVRILLAHRPQSILDAAEAGCDFQISGHTHGGQYFPFIYMVGLREPYTFGLHKHGRTMIYVSRGTGYWGPPMRLGAPSEITLITLTKAE